MSDRHVALQEVTNMFSQMHNLQRVTFLPFNYLPSLTATPSQALHSLLLTSPVSSISHESCLRQLTTLREVSFRGLFTMNETLLTSLSCLPQLQHLVFDKLLFPKTPFEQSCFHSAYFSSLRTLDIHQLNPMDSNGDKSGLVGQQFVLSLPNLQHVIFGMGAANQLVQDTLNRMTTLKSLMAVVPRRLESVFTDTEAANWSQWSHQRGIHFEYVSIVDE